MTDYPKEQRAEAFAAADRYVAHIASSADVSAEERAAARTAGIRPNPLLPIAYADGYLEGRAVADVEIANLRGMALRVGVERDQLSRLVELGRAGERSSATTEGDDGEALHTDECHYWHQECANNRIEAVENLVIDLSKDKASLRAQLAASEAARKAERQTIARGVHHE